MTCHVLDLLPLSEEERAGLEGSLPGSEWRRCRRSAVDRERMAWADIVLGAPRPADLAWAEHLVFLQSQWAGVDEYLAPGVLPAGAALACCPGAHDRPVSEHLLACLLSLWRKLPGYRDCQHQHAWRDLGRVRTLNGAVVLVVGAGRIGAAFARMCRALGAYTVGLRRTPAPSDAFDEVLAVDALDDLLPRADAVALTLPHTPRTAGIMSAARIARMKPDAVLLNAGRGSAVDVDALAAALTEGRLWGAALDVFDPEPLPPDSPLWDVPGLLITPHVAGGLRMDGVRRAVAEVCADNLRRFAAGLPPAGLVIPGSEPWKKP